MPFALRKATTCASPMVAPNGGGYRYSPPPYAVQQPGQWGSGGTGVTGKVAASGNWCPPNGQPVFSRFREDAFGAGFLDVLSPTEALWSFYSQGTAMLKPTDQVLITRRNPKCAGSGGVAGGASAVRAKVAPVANVTAAKAAEALKPLNVSGVAASGGVNLGSGVSGLARGAGAYLSAKKASANFTATTVANAVRNKTASVFASG